MLDWAAPALGHWSRAWRRVGIGAALGLGGSRTVRTSGGVVWITIIGRGVRARLFLQHLILQTFILYIIMSIVIIIITLS